MKLAWKLTILFSIIFSLFIILFSYGYFVYTRSLVLSETKRELERVLISRGMMMGRGMGFQLGLRYSTYYIYSEILGIIQDPFNIGVVNKEGIVEKDQNYYFFIRRDDYVVGKDITSLITAINRLRRSILYTGFIGILISSFLGYLLSNRFLKPIREVIKTVKEIDAKKLKMRVKLPRQRDELWDLINTLNNMLEKVEKAYAMQEQFISDVSHELKTPLTNILGYVKMLKRWGKEDEKVLNESLDVIEDTAENMKNLIEVLLEMAKIQEKISKDEIDIEEFLHERIVYYERMYPEFHFALKIDSNTKIYSSKILLEILFNILVDNAVKNSLDRKVIELGFSKGMFFVKDYGRGIPESEKEKIFERFYKVDKSRSSEGYGLGLSLAKKICDVLNIKIDVESKENEGSTFYLKIL
ncbi:MAG: two-component sensor histidine kinase [Dictyoglomus sp. NZ13-RE01]|nr:MAG: two-component sensor histidine kinase [Dictyoglomus sp. NZ13-RE01]